MLGSWWFSHSVVSDICDSMNYSPPGPLSMGFPRQEYWRGLPFLPPGDLLYPEIKPASPALAGRFFTTEPPGRHLSHPPNCSPSFRSSPHNGLSTQPGKHSNNGPGLARWPSGWDFALPQQEAWFQSLVGELQPHMPRGAARNKHIKVIQTYAGHPPIWSPP